MTGPRVVRHDVPCPVCGGYVGGAFGAGGRWFASHPLVGACELSPEQFDEIAPMAGARP